MTPSREGKERILIVDDEAASRRGLANLVASWGYVTEMAEDGEEALEKIERFRPDVVIADLVMPRKDGMDLLRELARGDGLEHLSFIMLTAKGSIASAVEAMKLGAFDYLAKPVDTDRLGALLETASARVRLWPRLERYESDIEESGRFGRLVGRSAPMRRLYQSMRQVGPTGASVLIVGESGTGKELVARTLHEISPRRDGPFVAINCAAIPESLLESEIFGHEKGAFTGAEGRRRGCFELADRGTLFLDEVAEMAPATQVKLLRVLEERAFRRLGGAEEIRVDVRVLAATNRDVDEALGSGRLREDLYYRLNVFTLRLPPLRERKEDIPLLAEHFLRESRATTGKNVEGFAPATLERLRAYHWPGNVRELRNVVERAVIVTPSPTIPVEALPERIGAEPAPAPAGGPTDAVALPVGTTVQEAERRLILRTLEATGQNKTRAAEILGISLKTLHNKLKKYRQGS